MTGLSPATLSAWKARLEVDYFTDFIKAYILFNAWCHTLKPGEKKDAVLLEYVKNGTDNANTVRRKMLPLLRRSDDDALAVQNRINQLHRQLKKMDVGWNDELITFEHVHVARRETTREEHEERGVKLSVRKERHGMIVEVFNSKSKKVFSAGPDKYKWENVTKVRGYRANVSKNQKLWLHRLFDAAHPDLYENLLKTSDPNKLCFDSPEKVFAAVVDVIYKLRCRLFHGEETPLPSTNELYRVAHAVLMDFVEAIEVP